MCWTLLFSFLLPLLFLDDNFLLNANEMRSAKRASGRLPSRWTWQKKRKKKKSSSRRWLESGDGQSIGASAAVCLGMGKKCRNTLVLFLHLPTESTANRKLHLHQVSPFFFQGRFVPHPNMLTGRMWWRWNCLQCLQPSAGEIKGRCCAALHCRAGRRGEKEAASNSPLPVRLPCN